MIHPIHEWENLFYNLHSLTKSMMHPIHEWVNLFYNLYSLTKSMIHPVLLFTKRSSSKSVRLANGLQTTTPPAD